LPFRNHSKSNRYPRRNEAEVAGRLDTQDPGNRVENNLEAMDKGHGKRKSNLPERTLIGESPLPHIEI
jgi:hypothetical protein